MSITVKDILQLDILKATKLVAGKEGLNREVLRVNFTDSPLDTENPGYNLVCMGDLYIHSFYPGEDNEEKFYNLIDFYIQTKSCCCIGVKYSLKELPERMLRLANKEKYPIIMTDDSIPYGQLIKDITELIMTEQLDLHSENKLNRLLFDHLTVTEQCEVVQYLLPRLPKKFYCFYVTYPDLPPSRFRNLKQELSENHKIPFLRYQRGGFLILDAAKERALPLHIDFLLKTLGKYGEITGVGISSCYYKNGSITACFKEAIAAHEISRLNAGKATSYDNIFVYSLLLPLREQDVLSKFVRDTLAPLREYEVKHSVDLVETIRIYFETNGNSRETAIRMNTHENTIRFRIAKAKNLLGLDGEPYIFIERISIALKAQSLLQE